MAATVRVLFEVTQWSEESIPLSLNFESRKGSLMTPFDKNCQ